MADTNRRGGARPGAGRKAGSGHAEATTVVRLPVDLATAARRAAEARGGNASGIGAFLKGEARTSASAPLVRPRFIMAVRAV